MVSSAGVVVVEFYAGSGLSLESVVDTVGDDPAPFFYVAGASDF